MKSKNDKQQEIMGMIFSRDRAMQLDGLLQSFFLHCKDANQAQLSVLYKATDERHVHQYQILSSEYAGLVNFVEQSNFRRDLLSILTPHVYKEKISWFWILSAFGNLGFPPGSFLNRIWRRSFRIILIRLARKLLSLLSDSSYVFFLVDDNIFIRDFYLCNIVETLKENDDVIAFSLRLGENTTYCYTHDHPQALPNFIEVHQDVAKFDWTISEYDFGYPFDISSSLYRLNNIIPLMIGQSFNNPNSLEEQIAYHANSFRTQFPFLACYHNSVTFCNPVNLVQTTISNRAGEKIEYTTDELSAQFEQGKRIKVNAYNGFVPNSCHQEVKFVFEKRDISE